MVFRAVLGTALCALLLPLTSCEQDDDTGDARDPGDRSAPAPTRCDGELSDRRVEGDLVVPRGKTCRLDGVTITGRTSVMMLASLRARDTAFGQGVGAHGFRDVRIEGGAPGGPARVRDYAFGGGESLRLIDVDLNGAYVVTAMVGRVEIRDTYLDLGSVLCHGNAKPPWVRGIRAETPGKLQGQCAGLRNFDPSSDF